MLMMVKKKNRIDRLFVDIKNKVAPTPISFDILETCLLLQQQP